MHSPTSSPRALFLQAQGLSSAEEIRQAYRPAIDHWSNRLRTIGETSQGTTREIAIVLREEIGDNLAKIPEDATREMVLARHDEAMLRLTNAVDLLDSLHPENDAMAA